MHRRHCRPMNFHRHTVPKNRRVALFGAACLVVLSVLSGCSSHPKDPTAGWTAEKIFEEARSEAADGNFDKAAKLFEQVEGRGAGTMLSQQALLERAFLLYRSGDKAQALVTVERFVKLHSTSPAIDYGLYLQGLINFNDDLGFLGNLSRQDLSERDQQAARDSFQSFKQLVEQHPKSRYTPDARERMDYISNMLASYEVHVARYYYRRGAYVAAANRAQQTVQEFQQAPSAEEALSILIRSYDKLGLDQLRDDAERVMRASFPNSALLSGEGFKSTQRAWWQLW